MLDQNALITDRLTGILCPACRADLRFADLAGVQVAACPDCRGLLIQQSQFASLIENLRANHDGETPMPKPMDPAELRVQRICTVCETRMETHPYAGPGNSIIDTCPQCHLIWFDAGELNKLVRAPGRRIR